MGSVSAGVWGAALLDGPFLDEKFLKYPCIRSTWGHRTTKDIRVRPQAESWRLRPGVEVSRRQRGSTGKGGLLARAVLFCWQVTAGVLQCVINQNEGSARGQLPGLSWLPSSTVVLISLPRLTKVSEEQCFWVIRFRGWQFGEAQWESSGGRGGWEPPHSLTLVLCACVPPVRSEASILGKGEEPYRETDAAMLQMKVPGLSASLETQSLHFGTG